MQVFLFTKDNISFLSCFLGEAPHSSCTSQCSPSWYGCWHVGGTLPPWLSLHFYLSYKSSHWFYQAWTQWLAWLFMMKRKSIAVQTQDSLRQPQIEVAVSLLLTGKDSCHIAPGQAPLKCCWGNWKLLRGFQGLSDEWVDLPVLDVGLPERHMWDWSRDTSPRFSRHRGAWIAY